MSQTKEESQIEIRKLTRELTFMSDKNKTLEESFMLLRKEHEDLMIKGQQEVQEVKTQFEGRLEKSNQKVSTLERANATILQEKKSLDEQMSLINQQLDIVSTKMEERNTQIK